MGEPRIGRVVAAALHQALADCLPLRLEHYETWIRPWDLRGGRVGVAPFAAALSFLRREDDVYPRVVERAGRYAADWTVAAIPAMKQAWARRLPSAWRLRWVLRTARDVVQETAATSRAAVAVTRGRGRIEITGSAFCDVRSPGPAPLCGFYAALVSRLAELVDLHVHVTTESCRATGAATCTLLVARAAVGEAAGGRPSGLGAGA